MLPSWKKYTIVVQQLRQSLILMYALIFVGAKDMVDDPKTTWKSNVKVVDNMKNQNVFPPLKCYFSGLRYIHLLMVKINMIYFYF